MDCSTTVQSDHYAGCVMQENDRVPYKPKHLVHFFIELKSDPFCSQFEDKLSEVDVRKLEDFYGKGSAEWHSVHMDMVPYN